MFSVEKYPLSLFAFLDNRQRDTLAVQHSFCLNYCNGKAFQFETDQLWDGF